MSNSIEIQLLEEISLMWQCPHDTDKLQSIHTPQSYLRENNKYGRLFVNVNPRKSHRPTMNDHYSLLPAIHQGGLPNRTAFRKWYSEMGQRG